MTGGSTLLLELRAATRADHERIEERMDVVERVRRPSDYAALVAGFHSVYAPLERAVSASPSTCVVVPDWADRRKAPWLEADLRALGCAPDSPAGVPQLDAPEDVVGAVYVMEGATLGGAVVERTLAALPDPPPHRFFTGYGDRRGAMWRAFRVAVGEWEQSTPGLDRDRVVGAATRTFLAVERACIPEQR